MQTLGGARLIKWTGRPQFWFRSRRKHPPAASETRASIAPSGTSAPLMPPKLGNNKRLILHFGAVDHSAKVWVNGKCAVEHEGGYTPFSADITDLLRRRRTTNASYVRAYDDPADLAKPRGKQDWQLEPHSIWYPANDRHLADRVDGARAVNLHRLCSLHARSRALGDRVRSAAVR